MTGLKTPIYGTNSEEFLLTKDTRLAYEPLKNKQHREYAEKIMDMYIKSTSKYLIFNVKNKLY